jgi:DNA-binding Lrp family transcriptional regulator
VFALVVDSDNDKGAGWTPTVPTSLAVETSPGNAHFWFFLETAVNATTGQMLGERLRAATNADSDTGNVCQPYRVAGTTNYPGKKKRERGRIVTWTRSLGFDPETLWTFERFEQEFPATERGTNGGDGTGTASEADIPAEVMDAIQSMEKGGRGQVLWNVVKTLKEDGWTVAAIVALLDKYPNGLAAKFRGRLQREVERVYDKIKGNAGSDASARKTVVMSCAEDLRTMTFDPLKYVVPGILVEGLTVLAGKPKTGKSWLLLHAAIAVARGGFTLGELHCIEGDVLYCALEDNARRMQSRMTKLLGISQPWPKRLTLCYDLPRLGEGGAEAIRDWISSVPNPRMVAIDTLAMIRALKKVDESNYQSDYLALIDLRALANEFGIALPVSHHLRKAEADDPFDTISGTLGLTGAVDSMLVLKRSVGNNYVLHGKGRDLIEIEKALTFDRDACLWRIAGDAAPVRQSAERAAILDAIAEAGQPIGPNDIATATGTKAGNVRFLLFKLVKEGVIEKAGYGKYQMPGTAQSAAPSNGNARARTAKARSDDDGPVVEPITAGEMDELRRRGFSPDELFNMSPTRARTILADPKRNTLTERYGKGSAAPPETICRVCKKPGAKFFSEPLGPGERSDRFPGSTPLHLECAPKFFASGSLGAGDLDEHGAPRKASDRKV